ncbi:MAG TPA: PilZ domain-containing protein [Gemmataceae bacterium]|nr:PilZ domain-containing protein [Gemmataceae bacterium]
MSEPTPGTPGHSSGVSLERRAFVRFASEAQAVCRHAGAMAGAGWPGKVADISVGGLCLVLRHCFEPGTPLAIELPGARPGRARTLLVRVRHATAQADGTWLVGCAFAERLSEEELKALL